MTGQVAKTSETHPIRIATLHVGNGKIGITFCPGKKQRGAMTGTWDRDLRTDLESIRDWGACDIVSLVEVDEMIQLGVEELPAMVSALGLRWHHLPIADQSTPDALFEIEWRSRLPGLVSVLRLGGGVLVHCKGGLGRAGTIAARLLLACAEMPASQAIAMVRAVRPGAIETLAQERYVLAQKM